MGVLEGCGFSELPVPPIYFRYIDVIFVQVNAEEDLQNLRDAFISNFSPNFTCERKNEVKLPFLNSEVKQDIGGFHTQVYVKKNNLGQCLNGESEYPQKYKDNVIGTFVRRILTQCSSWLSPKYAHLIRSI